MAADILGVGKGRIHIDPDMIEEVSTAMTRGDIRKYIGLGFIKKKPIKSNSRGRKRKKDAQKAKGRRRGHGTKKGKHTARRTKKEAWMKKIRAQRKLLREFKDNGKLKTGSYREIYRKAGAGVFKNKAHMKRYIKEKKFWDAEGKPKPKAKKPTPKIEAEKGASEPRESGASKNKAQIRQSRIGPRRAPLGVESTTKKEDKK